MPSDGLLASARIASYREPPWGACRFVQEQFGATPDKWQEELLVAWVNPRIQRISLQACAGPGKTCGEAWCAWHFIGTQASEGEHPNGFATSITADNLRDNLWKELAKWQLRSEYLSTAFRWGAERIVAVDYPATWFLAARTWPKTGTAEEQGRTFSGLHGKHVLVLVDESGAIPPTVLRAGEQALANTTFGKVLQGGNPISLEGMLYEAATRLAHQWHIIIISGDPDNPDAWVHSPRVAAAHTGEPDCSCAACWARGQIQTYSRENPWVQAYILGKFPPSSLNALLSYQEVLDATKRTVRPEVYAHMQKRIGVDVARFGDDRTVLFPRQGLRSFNPVVMRGANTNQIVARLLMAKARWSSELELVDNSFAWGNGVLDNLITAGHTPHAVDFAGDAIDRRYANRRAEGWLQLRDWIRRGGVLPESHPEIIAELTSPTYTFSKDGQFLLEPKDQVKKRLGRSPDLGDALALTHMLPDCPGQLQQFTRTLTAAADGARPGHAATEYDPFARKG